MISSRLRQLVVISSISLALYCPVLGQIEQATDGPKPLSPEETERSFQVPPGFRVELVAAEPLIQAPSGVCWDAEGRLYVSELHGYNLEGQYDIEALNETGQLDRVVRRIQADEAAKKKAESGTFGVIKRLRDRNGDGRMDEARVFARDLPPCYGMVAAREGIIAACAPHIYYLADSDGDGVADVREILYTGFEEGILERRINAPQWGLDDWIYFGGGGRIGEISGPYLSKSVSLGRSDFRVKSDGSAIEAVAGHTGTFGHSFTAEGDRITISTGTPGYQVIPLPWRYLTRNSELSVPALERNAASYQATFPLAQPHPWRTRRYEDPGFSRYYTDHYGSAESTPSGYFTSACSPLVYRDSAFPATYTGANFTCEPAQNLIHHSVVQWEGAELRLIRGGVKPEREQVLAWAEMERSKKIPVLPTVSAWKQIGPLKGGDKAALFERDFGPEAELDLDLSINGLSWSEKEHYQDGRSIDLGIPENSVVYLYRTVVSQEEATVFVSLGSNDAIKCWLNGHLLVANNVNRAVAPGQEIASLPLRRGENSFLMKIVNGTNASGFYFKLLTSLIPDDVRRVISRAPAEWSESQYQLAEKYVQTLEASGSDREFLASTDPWFHPMNLTHGPEGAIYVTDYYREIIEDYSAIPRYLQQQYGLTNGMHHGRIWRLTHESVPRQESHQMARLEAAQLAGDVASPRVWRRETARRLLTERGANEVQGILVRHLGKDSAPGAAINSLYTLVGIDALGANALDRALGHPDWSVQRHAMRIGDAYPPQSEVRVALARWLFDVTHYGEEARLLLQIALSLGEFSESRAVDCLAYLAVHHGNVRWMDTAIVSSVSEREEALLERVVSNPSTGTRLAELLVATIASRANPAQVRRTLEIVEAQTTGEVRDLFVRILEAGLEPISEEARFELEAPEPPDEQVIQEIESVFPDFKAALGAQTSQAKGRDLFAEHCSACHQAGGIGQNAGPNLNSEFQRAPETILRDILFPHEAITEGFETLRLEMRRGADVMGLFASESPTSLTLRFPSGQEMTFLRKNIARIHTHAVSLMPAQFATVLKPEEVAAIIGFVRGHRVK